MGFEIRGELSAFVLSSNNRFTIKSVYSIVSDREVLVDAPHKSEYLKRKNAFSSDILFAILHRMFDRMKNRVLTEGTGMFRTVPPQEACVEGANPKAHG